MDPTSPIPPIFAIFVSLLTCFILRRGFTPPDLAGRFATIDGLRGYLAFAVFMHHSMIWFFYLQTGEWRVPPSQLYTHFGEAGVALFFMITGFLFFSKILHGKHRRIDWLRLYVSRFLRLMPLYAAAIATLLVIVLIVSNFTINEPARRLLKHIFYWLGFTIFGAPDINAVTNTWIIIAGVTWSLPYEWFFYLLLPLFGVITGNRVAWKLIALSCITLIIIHNRNTSIFHWLAFAGGVATSLVVRSDYLCEKLRSTSFSIVAIVLLSLTVSLYPSARGYAQIVMLSAAFTIIAAGNNFFGLFTSTVSRTLGEMAYSIYLLHGLLLFTVFGIILGPEQAKLLSPVQYWSVIIGLTPVLTGLAFASYRKIEHPSLQHTENLTTWLREKFKHRP